MVLDFGCGSGVLFRDSLRLFDRVIGVDLVLAGAKVLVDELALERVELMSPEYAATKVPEASIDVIVAAEVLEHVEDLSPTLVQFRKWLKPGGRLLVSLPTENDLYRLGRKLAGFSGHYHHSNAASIDRRIVGFGFHGQKKSQIPAPGPLSIYWVLEYT